MSDPLSIAGLSVAIFDQLLKLGERTAQLISDARSFNEDTDTYYNKIIDENNRTRQLRCILFESSTAYDGACLFEVLDEDVQYQIKNFLSRGVHMLHEALELLENRHGNPDTPKPSMPSSMSKLSIASSRSSQEGRSPSPRSWRVFRRQSLSIIKWSFQDKKRTGEILRDYTDLNRRIHENVKLWCLADSLRVNDRQHLKRLQNDENSKRLGFDVDASLRIKAAEGGRTDISFELGLPWLDALKNAAPVEQRFALIQHDGRIFLAEYRRGGQPQVQKGIIDQRTKQRMNDLASLLSQPKEKVFCIPRCVGWTHIPSNDNTAFLFEIPEDHEPNPTSLYQLLDMKNVKLNLGQRFKLALALSNCIASLQLVKWVHESLRSENILFFPGGSSKESQELENGAPAINYADPYVLGFESSRPEIDFSAGFADVCLERDVYRHPERQGRPGAYFKPIHDIYALGVVLLEVGLWQRAITLEKNHFRTARDPSVIQAQLLKQAQRRLGDKMGGKYQEIVIACLTGQFGADSREDLKLQQAYRSHVVDVLEKIVEYI